MRFALVIALCTVISLAGASSTAHASPFSFCPRLDFPTSGQPYGLDVGDINGDGFPDVAYSYSGGILLGDGQTPLGGGTIGGIVGGTNSIKLGDVNGDGKLDVVSGGYTSGWLSVQLGMGRNSFSSPTLYYAGAASPWGVALVDLNGDGHLDIATADGPGVAVFLGVGDGTFGPYRQFNTAGSSASIGIAVADLNGDHVPDIVLANESGSISVLLGVGDGTFSPAIDYRSGVDTRSVAVADFNGDGRLDVVAANAAGDASIFLGAGDGTLTPGPVLVCGSGSWDVKAADLDGDGRQDVVVSNEGSSTLSLFLGHGDGTFTPQQLLTTGPNPTAVVVADMNGDGLPDLVAANTYGNSISVLLQARTPQVVSVLDVPNDQGGKVSLAWRFPIDRPPYKFITGYRVWRSVPALMLAGEVWPPAGGTTSQGPSGHRIRKLLSPDQNQTTYWEAIAELPASRLQDYGYTAPTTADSVPGSNPLTSFFVEALTPDPFVSYDSPPDSGYSVDNLSPPTPAPFSAVYGPGSNALHWVRNPAPDFLEFRLYRGASADFAPSFSNLVAAIRDTGFVDSPGAVYYKLAAADVHGNLSRYAVVSPSQPTATLASLVSADATAYRIRLVWYTAGGAGSGVTLYRREAATDWSALGPLTADGTGFIRYEDLAVTPGTRYGYRLGLLDGGSEVFAGEVWAVAAQPEFALLGARPNPAVRGRLSVAFVLPTDEPATLELLDVSGRRVLSREVGSLGPGRHTVDLAGGTQVPAGVYLVRYSQGAKAQMARVVVLK